MTKTLLIEKKMKGICVMTLNRPDVHNALDTTLITTGLHALQTVEQDPDIRLLLITAAGKTFCAGADLQWMQRMHHASPTENKQDAIQLGQFFKTLYHLSKPTMCLVQGSAFGGGLGIMACCDMVFTVPAAQFCFSEVKLGLVPASIAPYVMAAIGERQTMRYFLSAEKFSAEEALNMQLVHHIVASEKLSDTGFALAEKMLQHGPLAMQNTKRLIRNIAGKPIDASIEQACAESIAEARASAEGLEGIQAFLEKRSAKF